MNTKMVEVINQLQTVAPEIWNAAITDSYLSAGGYACWTVLLFVGVIGTRRYAAIALNNVSEDKYLIKLTSGVVQGFLLLGVVAFAYESLSYLISPELHAYESLVKGLK